MKTIYYIENKRNGKRYVGQTRDYSKRFKEHIKDSKRNLDSMSWNTNLYKDMVKDGENNFRIKPLESVSHENAHKREQYWIKELNTLEPNGYNLTSGGEKNKTYSDITKERIGKTTKERWENPESAKRMREGLKKAGMKKGYEKVPRETRQCRECKNDFICLETSDQVYCSQACALPDIQKKSKEVYMESRKEIHEDIRDFALTWALDNKETIKYCPFNRIKSNLEPLFDSINKEFDVIDYRVISKAISGIESRKELLKTLKEYIK